MARTANPPRVHCNVEWHLRSHPRANSVYGLALHVTKGKGPFYLSVHQVGDFFGWDVKTVRAAFRTLRDCGFFTLIRRGSGGIGQVSLANVYSVTTHSKLPKDKYPCRPLPEIGSLVSLADAQGRGKTGSTPLPETGSLRPLPETGSLVSDSPSKSSSAANAPGKKRSAPPEFSFFPADFVPSDENRTLAAKLGLDLSQEVPAFRDHNKAQCRQSGDWNCLFNSWLRKAAQFNPRHSSPPPLTGSLTENYQKQIARYQ